MRNDNKYLKMLRDKRISFNHLCRSLKETDIRCNSYELARILSNASADMPLSDKHKRVIKFTEEYVKNAPAPTKPSGNDFAMRVNMAGVSMNELYMLYDERYGTHLDFNEWLNAVTVPLLTSDYRVAVKADRILDGILTAERKVG